MTDFGQLYHQYVTNDLLRLKNEIPNDLFPGIFETHLPENQKAREISSNRLTFRNFLKSPSIDIVNSTLNEVYIAIFSDRFDSSAFNNAMNSLDSIPTVQRITGSIIGSALTTKDVEYKDIIEFQRLPHKPKIKKKVTAVLKGYKGEQLNSNQISQFLLLNDFLSKGKEFQFRKDLFNAEREMRRRNPGGAVIVYRRLKGAETDPERRKFLAYREAVALASQGDEQYRRAPKFSDATLKPAIDLYKEAQVVFKEAGFSLPALDDPDSIVQDPHAPPSQNPFPSIADNPVHRLFASLTARIAKANAHMNPLGLHDAFVPLIRKNALEKAFRLHHQGATDAANQLFAFLQNARHLKDLKDQIKQEHSEAVESVNVFAEKQNIARQQQLLVDNTRNHIFEQKNDLAIETVAQSFQEVLSAAADGIKGGPQVAALSGVSGVISIAVDYNKRVSDLNYQERAAIIEESAANSQKNIADIEKRVAESRVTFLANHLEKNQVDRILYDSLANEFERIAHARLSEAHLIAYLFDRFICYRLGRHNRHIRFDYLDTVQEPIKGTGTEILPALSDLKKDFDNITKKEFIEEQLDKAQIRILQDDFEIDLEERFPLEFQRFRQSGRMNFSISLYDLDKKFPGQSHMRILKCTVDVTRNLGLPTNFSGLLIHRGFFLARDRDTSIDAKRLVPTDSQIQQALDNLRMGNLSETVVGGVRVFAPGESALLFDQSNQVASQSDLEEFFFSPIELMGPAALWTLQVKNVNPRIMKHVKLKFDVEFFDPPAPAEDFIDNIEALIKDYEKEIRNSSVLTANESLDKLVAFNVKPQFRDTFDDLIDNGESSFHFSEENVNFSFKELKVKGIVFQTFRTLNNEEQGIKDVGLEITQVETPGFSLVRTTRDDGFSEDVSGDIQLLNPGERFSVFGEWKIKLVEGSPAELIDNIRWFFVLEFIENN